MTLNEFQIIDQFIKPLSQDSIVMGMGDDCSVVKLNKDAVLIETTDCLVEDIHFRLRDFSMAELAYKALAVNISDISAMGGRPSRAHLSLALPKEFPAESIEEFFKTLNTHLESHQISLIGGDLSSTPGPVFINLHLAGVMQSSQVKWRKGLEKSGVLCVTGSLGDSSAGLWGMDNLKEEMAYESLVQAHKAPPILSQEACWLANKTEVQGMLDLSDGLYSDLHRLSSGHIVIDCDQLPLTADLLAFSSLKTKDPLEWALCGGEDYQLLVNCEKSGFEKLRQDFAENFLTRLTPIGEVAANQSREINFLQSGEAFKVPWSPFRHF